MSHPHARQRYGSKAPTQRALDTALRSLLTMRRFGKALSPGDVTGLARSYGRTEAQVVEMAREAGCEVA
jgi:hypothetical protein